MESARIGKRDWSISDTQGHEVAVNTVAVTAVRFFHIQFHDLHEGVTNHAGQTCRIADSTRLTSGMSGRRLLYDIAKRN